MTLLLLLPSLGYPRRHSDDGSRSHVLKNHQVILHSHQAAAAAGGPNRRSPSKRIVRINYADMPSPLAIDRSNEQLVSYSGDNGGSKQTSKDDSYCYDCKRPFKSRKALGGHKSHYHPKKPRKNSKNKNTVTAPGATTSAAGRGGSTMDMENSKHDHGNGHKKDSHPAPPEHKNINTITTQAPPPHLLLIESPPPLADPNTCRAIVAVVPQKEEEDEDEDEDDASNNIIPSSLSLLWGKKGKRGCLHLPVDPVLKDVAQTLVHFSFTPVIFPKEDPEMRDKFMRATKKCQVSKWEREGMHQQQQLPIQHQGAGTSPEPKSVVVDESIDEIIVKKKKRTFKNLTSITSVGSSSSRVCPDGLFSGHAFSIHTQTVESNSILSSAAVIPSKRKKTGAAQNPASAKRAALKDVRKYFY